MGGHHISILINNIEKVQIREARSCHNDFNRPIKHWNSLSDINVIYIVRPPGLYHGIYSVNVFRVTSYFKAQVSIS